MRGMSEEKLNILKKNYINLCCRPRTEAIEQMRRHIFSLEEQLQSYQRGIVQSIRDIEHKKVALEALKVLPDKSSKEVEFDRLIAHPDIDNISMDGDIITVFTKQIDIEHRGDVYDIGKFVIYLSTQNNDRDRLMVRFKNLTRNMGDGRPHPHVDTGGYPCLGNIKECLPQMIGSHQYAAAISVAIQYLKSYSNDQHGKPFLQITQWPKKRIPVIVPVPTIVQPDF